MDLTSFRNSFSVSVSSGNPAKAKQARVRSPFVWCPSATDASPFYKITFPRTSIVSGVGIQGDLNDDNWVERFQFFYDSGSQEILTQPISQEPTFVGNSERNGIVYHWFTPNVVAESVMIRSTQSHGLGCLRVQVFGCGGFMSVTESDTLSVTCGISGTLATTFSWTRNGAVIARDTSALTVAATYLSWDKSILQCIGEDSFGNHYNDIPIKLTVAESTGALDYPVISLSSPQVMKKDSDVVVACTAIAPVPVSIKWRRDGHVVSSTSVLHITNMDYVDSGTYICVATTSNQQRETKLHLVVR